jgi:small subunit ribosomal protein S6e
MNIVVSDKKSGKAFNTKTEQPALVGKKIGDEVDLGSFGLSGYKGKITGGSDKQGFPMKPGLIGSQRKKVLMQIGIGLNSKRKGMKKKKSVAGNTIGTNTAQINIVVTTPGTKKFQDFLQKEEVKPAEDKVSAKERMVKDSLEKTGSEELEHVKTKSKKRV